MATSVRTFPVSTLSGSVMFLTNGMHPEIRIFFHRYVDSKTWLGLVL